MTNKQFLTFILLALYLLFNSITFILYKVDKKRAIKNKWRIKEVTLLTFSFFVGGYGSLLGIFMLRHKTKHWYFPLTAILGTVLQTLLIIYLISYFQVF